MRQLAVIVAEGPDAGAFLAAQLGRSLPTADGAQGSLAGWHDAKGRVQALFRVFEAAAQTYWLATPADAAPGIVADLGRFVLRSRVTLRIDAGDLACIALIGDCAHALEWGLALTPSQGPVLAARLGTTLTHVIGPTPAIALLIAELPNAPSAAAELAEIRLGLPSVVAALRGQFLPQMLDLDRLGAIEFDHGCYPGQEIIVRLQHRGTVKRRLAHLSSTVAAHVPEPGDSILDADSRAVGQVIRAASSAAGIELLAVVDVDALHGELVLAGVERHLLRAAAAR